MQLLNEYYSFEGMQKDLNILKHPTTFLYDAKNIRITPREDGTLFAITNEKGTEETGIKLEGTYLGSCKINKYLVIFTTDNKGNDRIYRIDLDEIKSVQLIKANLNFSTDYPIDAIGDYENESIQKVYWTDGNNQPRVINICVDIDTNPFHKNSFDFIPTLKLEEEVKVSKILGSGEFPAGVIQYAFTYFNKYGQESNIFHVTPLNYISYNGRAGSPEDKIANAFKITISNLDIDNFEYVRIYSILRTSLNGTPLVKRLQDVKLLPNTTTEIKEDIYLENREFFTLDLYSNILVSTDNGVNFKSLTELDDCKVNNIKDAANIPVYYDINGTSQIADWNNYILKDEESGAYKFTRKSYENIIIRIDGNDYTWGKHLASYEEPTTLYIGLSPNNNRVIIAAETDNKGFANVGILNPKKSRDLIKGIVYIDTGLQGDIVDPTYLLYKNIGKYTASTIESFDNTLFLGNIQIKREPIKIKVKSNDEFLSDILYDYTEITDTKPLANNNISPKLSTRKYAIEKGDISYIDTLNSYEDTYPGVSGFKSNEYYRLGIQFQHETGEWSEPFWIGDKQCTVTPSIDESGDEGKIEVPEFEFTLKDNDIIKELLNKGYKKARPLFVVPTVFDRTILCQGIVCPTMYRKIDRWADAKEVAEGVWSGSTLGNIYAQSSWIFRTNIPSGISNWRDSLGNGGIVTSSSNLISHYDYPLKYTETTDLKVYSPYSLSTEIMGIFDDGHCFYIDSNFLTFHSPDVQFEDYLYSMDFQDYSIYSIGYTVIDTTYGNINVQTSSGTIGSNSTGFSQKTIKTDVGYKALISDFLYEDYIVQDIEPNKYSADDTKKSSVKWLIHMWHKGGSLNNDVNREGRSADLLKKVISNYRYCPAVIYEEDTKLASEGISLFSSDQVSLAKIGRYNYLGNIETMVTPHKVTPFYFSGYPLYDIDEPSLDTIFSLRTSTPEDGDYIKTSGVFQFKFKKTDTEEANKDTDIIWEVIPLYGLNKIGQHSIGLAGWREGISIKYKSTPHLIVKLNNQSTYLQDLPPGALGITEIRKPYNPLLMFGGTSSDALESASWVPCGPSVLLKEGTSLKLKYKWGDSYIQRYECLKTYPFTREDKNQVVEVASFIIETRVNLGGRYDKNKAQTNHLNTSPTNFNLINPVYSQIDNFFNYRILNKDTYDINNFPAQITWSLNKSAGADIDTWTNITLASIYDVEGSRGEISALKAWKDRLYCFQENGISQILFNSRVQINTSDGVPIEVGNSNKLDGNRYISDNFGCKDKDLIVGCNSGIYFIDNNTGHLIHLSEGFQDVSGIKGMNSWFNKDNEVKRLLYDNKYSDLYVITDKEALCFSEILGQFVSTFDYPDIDLLESYDGKIFTLKGSTLYEMFSGNYNYFFTEYKPWKFTFISNGVSSGSASISKIFSNIEYRMDILSNDNNNLNLEYLRVENSYQDTDIVPLHRLAKPQLTGSYHNKDANLQKKFRTWRIQIPRNKNSMDRIMDHWCKITLGNSGVANQKAVLYDLNVKHYV